MFEFLETNRKCLLFLPFWVTFPGHILGVPFTFEQVVSCVSNQFVVVSLLIKSSGARFTEYGEMQRLCSEKQDISAAALHLLILNFFFLASSF